MRIKLAILEKDQRYLNRIVAAFETKYADKFEIYSFTDQAIALSTLDSSRIDVLVASDTFDIDASVLPKRCGFAYFVDSPDVDTVNIKADIYTETNDYMTRLPFLPAATLGRLSVESSEITLRGIVDEGTLLKQKYDLLSNTYETVKTEVRKDLGDSIAKAFNNIDDILNDMNLDISEENRRAVRILGYNSMVITNENLRNVREVDAQVQSLINRMKPATVLQMIREGINPLDMNITEVVGKLNELDMAPDRRNESMSRFLYKLDKSKEITESERESYVGIYRLVNNLKSEDYAALGRVLEAGEELTLRNVLKEIRSEKRSYDVKIDDSFGLLDSTVGDINSISAQIEAACF